MPYEYGYELATCDVCGSSLFLSGEGCSNCNGEAPTLNEQALLHQASIAKRFNTALEAEAATRLLQEQKNAKFAHQLNSAVGQTLQRQQNQAKCDDEVEKALQQTISTFSPKIKNAIEKEILDLEAQSLHSFTKGQRKALLTILRIIRAADLMAGAGVLSDFIRKKRKDAIRAYQTLMGHPFDTRHQFGRSEARLSPAHPAQALKRVPEQTQHVFPQSQEIQPKSPRVLQVVGPKDHVQRAVEYAQRLALTPRYLIFSRNPNILWKAQVKLTRPWEDLKTLLHSVGWEVLQSPPE